MFTKFIYDGISSDEYGIMCVTFGDSESIATTISEKSDLKLEKPAMGYKFNITSHEYSEPLQYTMQIVNKDGSPITQEEERALKKWLIQRGKFKQFCIYDKYYSDIWFFANINNPKQIYVNDVNGLEFTVTTNSPFGFSDLNEYSFNLVRGSSFDLYVNTDEVLPIYPSIEVISKEAGILALTNTSIADEHKNSVIINNVSANEVITIDGNYPKISTSKTGHIIYEDFNLIWPSLVQELNTITVSLSCTLTISYREIRKVGII